MREAVCRFDTLLRVQLGVDYWADEGSSIAAGMISGFAAEGWRALAALIPQRDAAWLCCCAESLGDEVSEEAADLLQILLREDDPEVTVATLDALHSMAQLGLDLRGRTEAIRTALDRLPQAPGAATQWLVASLRKYLVIG